MFTLETGLAMLLYNIICLLIGAIIAYKILNRNNK